MATLTSASQFVNSNNAREEIFEDYDKENDPVLLVKEIEYRSKVHCSSGSVVPLVRRPRYLSLVDTNREVVTRKSRLGSVLGSVKKHRKTSERCRGEWSNDEESVLSASSWNDVQDISLRGHDWNDLIDSQNVEEVPRGRFLKAAESLTNINWKEDLSYSEDSDNSSEREIYQTPDVFLEGGKCRQKPVKNIPENVVDIDDNGEMSDYGSDIVHYLRQLETSFTLEHDFLDSSSVTSTMRSTLVDWLIQVQHHLKLCQETLYLGVSMLDLVLDKRDVDPDKLQLVGITSMLVASKLEEYYPADIKKLLHLTEDSYSSREILEMELVLVEVLEFQLYIPSPCVFLLRYHAASLHPSSPTFLSTCHYLVDSHLPATQHSCTQPSRLAAAATLTAGLLFFISTSPSCPVTTTVWTATLVHYTGYQVEDLLVTSMSMLGMVLSSMYQGAATKYKSMSQHNRLVLKDHLKKEVVVRALGILEGWSNAPELSTNL